MTPLEAGLLVMLCTLPFHYCVQREVRKLSDPRYLRENGIVIARLRALEGTRRRSALTWGARSGRTSPLCWLASASASGHTNCTSSPD